MSATTHPAAPGTAARGSALTAEQTGLRVQEVLDRLAASGDTDARAGAEELVRLLMDFYGAGLARIVALLPAGPAADGPLAALLDDELVSGLLVLHDLHPEDVGSRITRALATVPDQPVELTEFDTATGRLRLRSSGEGGGCGCSGTDQARQRIEAALACFAPEVTDVELAPADKPRQTLLQIGSRPPSTRPTAGAAGAR